MQYLFLDIASHKGLLACVTENAVVSSLEVGHKISDADLIPAVENLLKDAKWSYQDLTHIACVTGPGGFTSLRVAVTYVNVLADQLSIPLTGVHLSEVYSARNLFSQHPITQPPEGVERGAWGEGIYWLHSTKKQELFVRGGEWKEPTLVTLDQLTSSLPTSAQWMGELLPEHQAQINREESQLKNLTDILPEFVSQLSYDKKPLEPWYGRGW